MKHKDAIRIRADVEELLAAIRRDVRIINLLNRGREGRAKSIAHQESWEFLLQEVAATEKKALSMYDTLGAIQKILVDAENEQLEGFSRKELEAHLERFDDIFKAIAQQVITLNELTSDLKEQFVEFERKINGPYAPDPFQRKIERNERQELIQMVRQAEFFPSVASVMNYKDIIAKILPQQPGMQLGTGTTGMNPFGSTTTQPGSLFANKPTSLFGSKPTTSAFPFSSTPTTTASSTSSLFKPFGATTTASTTPSLFGEILHMLSSVIAILFR